MTQLLPPGGSPEKSENSSGFGQMSNKEKENYLHIQRAIGLEVCNLFKKLSPRDPFSLVFTGSLDGGLVKEAVLRSIFNTSLPKGMPSSVGEKKYRLNEEKAIRDFININSEVSFNAGFKSVQFFAISLEPYIMGRKLSKNIEQKVVIGDTKIPVEEFQNRLVKDPRGLTLIEWFTNVVNPLDGSAFEYQSKLRGMAFAKSLATIATAEFSSRYLKELKELKPI